MNGLFAMENAGAGLFLPRWSGVQTGGDFVFARATGPDRRRALVCAALLVLQFLAVIPFGHIRTPWITTGILVLPVILAATFATALIAVYYFWQEFQLIGRVALFLAGAAFLIRGIVPILQDWTNPHDIGVGSLFGADAGPALWLFNHAAFGLLIVIAFVFRQRFRPLSRASARRVVRAAAPAIPLAVVGVALALHAAGSGVPHFIDAAHGRFSDLFVATGVADAVLCAGALVAVAVSTRLETLLGLWIMVAIVGVICENLLLVVFPERPSIGFWLMRVDALLANAVIALFFLRRSTRLSRMMSAQRRWLSLVVDNVADALLTVDEAGVVTWCNRAAENVFGAPYAELVGSRISEWLPGFETARSEANGALLEIVALRRDATSYPVEITRTELTVEQETLTILIVRDITVRKQGEDALARARDQALRAARSKADFLATMSHEIRTPINAIIGMTELLTETLITPRQHEYAQTVHSSAQALRSIIDDVLDVSKLEAGKLELDSIPFDPLETVEAAADIVATQAHRKNVELITFVDPAIPHALWGDPNRLRQILLNLLGNAVKFTESGRIVVRAMLDERRREAMRLRFEVEDTGIGIAPESQQRLFSPFEQLDQSTSRRYGGTGLGLSISRRLVALMGGTMGLSSDVGQGSTFWFDAVFPAIEGEPPRKVDLGAMRVLIVGGDPVWRDAVAQTMRAWNVDVEAAPDAAGALKRLEVRANAERPFHVALIDAGVSGNGGIALGRSVAGEARFGGVRTVLVTGYGGATQDDRPEEAGFAHFLRRPVRREALLDALTGEQRSTPALLPPAEETLVSDGRAFRILLVEDHPVNRQVALRQLQRLGHTADVATNGLEAVAATAREDYQLVLMDCQMPEMDGFEATRAIRRRESATGSHLSIVAMTANAMEGDRETCLAAGMDGYLAKPVTLGDLRAVLAQYALTPALLVQDDQARAQDAGERRG
jgi:PAS domain S-box-containing protein